MERATERTTIDRIRTIVEHHQADTIDGILVDAFTASAIIAVHDALNDTNRARLASLTVERMATICFDLARKG